MWIVDEKLIWLVSLFTNLLASFAIKYASFHFIFLFISGSIWVIWHVVLCLAESHSWKATVNAFVVRTPKLHLQLMADSACLIPSEISLPPATFASVPSYFFDTALKIAFYSLIFGCESSRPAKGNELTLLLESLGCDVFYSQLQPTW